MPTDLSANGTRSRISAQNVTCEDNKEADNSAHSLESYDLKPGVEYPIFLQTVEADITIVSNK